MIRTIHLAGPAVVLLAVLLIGPGCRKDNPKAEEETGKEQADGTKEYRGCGSDAECKGTRICIDGACQAPPLDAARGASPIPIASPEEIAQERPAAEKPKKEEAKPPIEYKYTEPTVKFQPKDVRFSRDDLPPAFYKTEDFHVEIFKHDKLLTGFILNLTPKPDPPRYQASSYHIAGVAEGHFFMFTEWGEEGKIGGEYRIDHFELGGNTEVKLFLFPDEWEQSDTWRRLFASAYGARTEGKFILDLFYDGNGVVLKATGFHLVGLVFMLYPRSRAWDEQSR